jgi:hypothetical protein
LVEKEPVRGLFVRVQDFERVRDANSDEAIESALAERYGSGVNSLWLCHGGAKYPALALLVRADLASLHYFPRERHPGFRSVGVVEGQEPGESTAFCVTSLNDEQPIPNGSIVPFSTALSAA